MGVTRNRRGDIIGGPGSELTEVQNAFLERIKNEGIEKGSKIAKDMGYTNYYRDRRTEGTAFYREIMNFVESEAKSIEAAKGTNLTKLITIRDTALVNGDVKMAMEAIKIINDMQGYKAPTRVQQTKIDVKATIDLTSKEEDEDMDYLDVDYTDGD